MYDAAHGCLMLQEGATQAFHPLLTAAAGFSGGFNPALQVIMNERAFDP